MSHKNAPPLTPEQIAFEEVARAGLQAGHTVGFGRDKDGKYFARYVVELWAIWNAARSYALPGASEHG